MAPKLLVSALLLLPGLAAHADVQQFAFQLIPSYSPYAGSGSFSLNETPGQTTYTLATGLEDFFGEFAGVPFAGAQTSDLAVSLGNNGQVTGLSGDVGVNCVTPSATCPADGYFEFQGLTYAGVFITPNPDPTQPSNHYNSLSGTVTVSAVPEPSSIALLATGLLGTATTLLRRRSTVSSL